MATDQKYHRGISVKADQRSQFSFFPLADGLNDLSDARARKKIGS
jgi:hypothetical protein